MPMIDADADVLTATSRRANLDGRCRRERGVPLRSTLLNSANPLEEFLASALGNASTSLTRVDLFTQCKNIVRRWTFN